jgi:hypothetical protein
MIVCQIFQPKKPVDPPVKKSKPLAAKKTEPVGKEAQPVPVAAAAVPTAKQETERTQLPKPAAAVKPAPSGSNVIKLFVRDLWIFILSYYLLD